VPLPQLEGDVVDEEFVAGNGQAVLRIEVLEVCKLAGELVPQARVGEDVSVTLTFAGLYERPDD
jgi:hypothetical protein